MRRLVAAAAVLLLVSGGVLVIPSGSASAAQAQWVSYKDKFSERDYDGNNAEGNFSSDWIEVGEANGPVKGFASVTGHTYCQGDYCLQIGGGDLAVGNVGIARSINLDGALEAKVTYLYARNLMGGSADQRIAFQVSADGGTSFTTVETFTLDEDDSGMVRVRASSGGWIDITEFAAPQTVIRFISLDGAPDNLLLIDDVLVKGKFVEGPPPATTTTTTTTTLPPPTTTTTTTVPPTTTTTTTTVPPTTTTTTTEPPDSTSTTTTLPPTTTTTTTPPVASTGLPPPGSDESFRSKEGLVTLGSVARLEVPNDPRDGRHTGPVSIIVRFQTTAEALTGGALPSTILGVLMALLAVIGLSRRFRPLRNGVRARTQ
ncbi:MAG: hypothetical protein BMS9Abin07_0778 [Acidimicrobiia bacterium]|nr:MAG: hypothetical protein BMS9Abin07_0778 [Acidimicrobiia bacterium]